MALLCAAGVLLLGACGTSRRPTPAAARLQREDLVVVARTLRGAESQVRAEVAATKTAWPLVFSGIPDSGPARARARAAVRAAAARAAEVVLPTLFAEGPAAAITGPASIPASLFRGYATLATRGWQMMSAYIDQIEHGSPAAARFARANVDLYIETVYDAHFELAQIGKQLTDGYKKLEGPASFGASLTAAEVEALARFYSEPSDRLYPHTGVRLGS